MSRTFPKMPHPIKVVVVGGSGQTGRSVIDGLLAADNEFHITNVTRESSLDSNENNAYRARGIKVVAADLQGPVDRLVPLLHGADVVVSTVYHTALRDQVLLAEAAKEAGVKRFVPCNFGTPGIRGIVDANDTKLDVLDAILTLHLPYTVIDVGWWSELALSSALVPSGRLDYLLASHCRLIPGEGNVKNAFTSKRDIGKFVARIITDSRTLNRKVFAYTDVMTYNEVSDLVEEISGEKPLRQYISRDDILANIVDGQNMLAKDSENFQAQSKTIVHQYYNSYGLRGDNTPEVADYLGYLDIRYLYPDIISIPIRAVIQEALDGRVQL